MILILTFLAALGISLALTPAARRWAHLRGYLDHPDGGRKMHTAPVPRIGGAAVYLSFALAFGIHVAFDPGTGSEASAIERVYLHLLLACGAVMLVGLADDIRGVSPLMKVVVQAAAGAYLYGWGFQIKHVSNPFGDPVSLGTLSLPLTVLWFVGMSNAFNLIDGLDGLASGVAFFATGSLFAVAVLNEQWSGAALTVALAGAILGFLRYNFSPASIFLGDSGSLFVGFALAAFAIWNSSKASAAIAVAAPLLALALPILDVLVSVLRRLLNGRRVFEADHDHIHHRLVQMGFTPRRAVIILYGVSAVCASLSLVTMSGLPRLVALAIVVGALLAWSGVRRLGYAEISELQRLLTRKVLRERLTVANNTRLIRFGDHVARTQSLAELWDGLIGMASSLDFQRIEIRLYPEVRRSLAQALAARRPANDFPVWEQRMAKNPADHRWSLAIRLHAGDRPIGNLIMRHVGREVGLHFDPSYLLGRVSTEFAAGLARLLSEPATGQLAGRRRRNERSFPSLTRAQARAQE
jgi:UDP-GlcNAc:undecaprenyl-phosphate GlcNAc-1-phosphate transferase